jgi:hypothetical protein
MTEISDPNMDTAIQWANVIGPPPSLPASILDVRERAKLVNCVDSPLIGGSFLHNLKPEESTQRLNFVAELARSFVLDLNNHDEIKNLTLRLWAGCMSAAKEIAASTMSGLNTPERRRLIFSQMIDRLCENDRIYEAGVEAAPSLKNLRGEIYSLEGVPENSPVRRYST